MRIKTLPIVAVSLLALSFSMAAHAGSVTDSDSDLVADVIDNCVTDANGPAGSDQFDADLDGFGNACDCDFDQNNDQNGLDITQMFTVFLQNSPLHDIDVNGDVNGLDIVNCYGRFLQPPG